MREIGPLVANLRKQNGYSQERLAELLGCTKQTISNYERNTRMPDYETLEALADIFNVPMGFFLSEEEQEERLAQIYKSYNFLNRSLAEAQERIACFNAAVDVGDAIAKAQHEDDELWEIREEMRRNPEIRMLFSASKGAKKEHIKAAAAMLNALKGNEEDLE